MYVYESTLRVLNESDTLAYIQPESFPIHSKFMKQIICLKFASFFLT